MLWFRHCVCSVKPVLLLFACLVAFCFCSIISISIRKCKHSPPLPQVMQLNLFHLKKQRHQEANQECSERASPWDSRLHDHGVSSATYAYNSNCKFRGLPQTMGMPETQMIIIMLYCVNLTLKSFNKYFFENCEM